MFRNWFGPTKITMSAPGAEINFDLSRLANNLDLAHEWLNMQIAADMANFIPFDSGALRSSLNYPEGPEGTIIEYNSPYAHYMYEGEVYINPEHNASGFIGADGRWHGWAGPKEPSGRLMNYQQPGTGDHWFDRAWEAYGKSWVEGVKKITGRGL